MASNSTAPLAPDTALVRSLLVSTRDMRTMIAAFHRDMRRGLAGTRGTSLAMIPTYVDKAAGTERGVFLALDLGGTNFRVLTVTLAGRGRMRNVRSQQFTIPPSCMTGSGASLFDFIVSCIQRFLRTGGMSPAITCQDLGFTFSFPVKQTAVNAGTLIMWTKGFSARGVEGNDVVVLLNQALARAGLTSITVAALANDTVGTLVAKSYSAPACDVGVIIGTGTNACYRERLSAIKKWRTQHGSGQHMIINIEWGNFNKIRRTIYDRALDQASENPGKQIMEKMISGRYLGEIVRRALADGARRRHLGTIRLTRTLATPYSLKAEYVSRIDGDASKALADVAAVLGAMGITRSTIDERRAVREISRLISHRAARISAAALAAVVSKIDPRLARRHVVAIDGSVYEKHPHFASAVRSALAELFGRRSQRIQIQLAKDGSGIGAAVIAAVAAAHSTGTRTAPACSARHY